MILKFVRNHLRLLGLFHLPNDDNKHVKFAYIRNYLVFVSLGFFTIPTFCYFLFEATTFSEYVNSFFFTLCGLLGISFKANLLLAKPGINQLIIKFDEICSTRRNFSIFVLWKLYFLHFSSTYFAGGRNSALKSIYDEADGMIESRTKVIHTIMLKASVPIIVLQFIFWSFFQYIRTDFSDKSFRLIYPWA